MQMEIEESGGNIMSVQYVKRGGGEVKQLIEFWSNIKNVENATPENVQSDILAYLQEIERLKLKEKWWEEQYTTMSEARGEADAKAQRLEEALKEIRKGKMSYSQMVILADTVIDKETKGNVE
jgi:hypothetical protein